MQTRQDLPKDVESLTQLVLEKQAALDLANAALLSRQLEVEKLKIELLRLKRQRFGRSSEQLEAEIARIELTLEDLEASETESLPVAAQLKPAEVSKPHRRPLPRETSTAATPCACLDCGGALRSVGEDVTEMLEYEPARFKVIRHVRPKFSCASCESIIQSPAPSRPIARGLAGPGLLAHVLTSKYCDHLPLYRQSEIYAREGVELDRSTLTDWVGQSSGLLAPLIAAVGRYVLAANKVHADDTPVPVLAPAAARPARGDCGRTCAMIDRRGAMRPRRCGSPTRRIARACIRAGICAPSAARCRPMAMRASISSTTRRIRNTRSKRRLAGRTCGVSSTTSIRPPTHRSPSRR